MTLKFKKEKETKNTVRYQEVVSRGDGNNQHHRRKRINPTNISLTLAGGQLESRVAPLFFFQEHAG